MLECLDLTFSCIDWDSCRHLELTMSLLCDRVPPPRDWVPKVLTSFLLSRASAHIIMELQMANIVKGRTLTVAKAIHGLTRLSKCLNSDFFPHDFIISTSDKLENGELLLAKDEDAMAALGFENSRPLVQNTWKFFRKASENITTQAILERLGTQTDLL